jgi:hypothetical protein
MELFGVAIVVLLVGITLAVLARSETDRGASRTRREHRERHSK